MLSSLLKKTFRGHNRAQALHARLQEGYARLLADDIPAAIEIATEVTKRDPARIEAQLLLAQATAAGGAPDEALLVIERVLGREPGHAEARYVRGMIHEQCQRLEEAIADYGRVLAADPSHAGALERKGALHDYRGEFEQALECARRLVQRDPNDARAHDQLGITLRELSALDAAAASFRRALEIDAGLHSARCHLALVRAEQGSFAEAEAELAAVLAAQADHREARWTRAVSRLLQGRFEAAWDDYEWRERKRAHPLPQVPEWDGAPLDEGALLLYAEQALGDQMMFASCLPDALERAPTCVVECDRRLQALFQRSFPGAIVIPAPEERGAPLALPSPMRFAAQLPVGSLPRLFRRDAKAFPAHRGYLRPDPLAVARWRQRLQALGPGMKIGLSWTGGAAKTRRRLRSLPLEQLLPLFRAGECQFVNLQYVDSAAEITSLAGKHGLKVHDFPETRASYDETAALVGALDLVISVCTAVIHLAGAIGTSVWIMAPAAPEWRYLASGSRMPWYPEARIWRQSRLGQWEEVVAAIAAELTAAIRRHGTQESDRRRTDAR